MYVQYVLLTVFNSHFEACRFSVGHILNIFLKLFAVLSAISEDFRCFCRPSWKLLAVL